MRDGELVAIVDAAVAEAVRRGGAWIVCRPGCAECCMGPCEITQLDALRLRRGFEELRKQDVARAARVRERAQSYAGGDDEACPALDPETRTCDLYASRPLTCRMFGPAIRCGSGDIGACELCFDGAKEEEIAACAVEVDPEALESEMLGGTDVGPQTTVASALLTEAPEAPRNRAERTGCLP
jgi:Fe-S-cluster containining protein